VHESAWPVAGATFARVEGRFPGNNRRQGDAAPDDGCDGLTQANSWRPVSKRDMRNQVAHGKLISPWSTEEEDARLLDLANLMHALTFNLVPRRSDFERLCSVSG
jgi:hypothetical protein